MRRLGVFGALACGLAGGIAAAAALAKDAGAARDTIDTVVIHTIGGPSCSDEGTVQFRPVHGDASAWKSWFESEPVKGIHYVVDRAGLALASIPESQVANHVVGHNDTSIGIELVNDGDGVDPFPPAQIDALVVLLCDILARNHLEASAIKGHADLDHGTMTCGGEQTRRKVDPGARFPWQDVLERTEACLLAGAPPAPARDEAQSTDAEAAPPSEE